MNKYKYVFPSLYLLSIILDLYSTFLASPNLEGENAIDVKLLDLNWQGVILFSGLYFIIFTFYFLYSITKITTKQNLNSLQYYFYLLGILLLLQNIFSSFLASINNFILYLLHNKTLNQYVHYKLLDFSNLNYDLYHKIGFTIIDMFQFIFLIILYYFLKSKFSFRLNVGK